MIYAFLKDRRPARMALFLSGLLVLALSAVFVLSLTGYAFSRDSMPAGEAGSIQGEVIAVDSGHAMKTMTLESDQIGKFPNNSLNIFVNRGTKVNVCGMSEPASDLQVDRTATVTYHEVGGVAVADRISERC